jgi:murein DD-endopeptidase MepM/ murein hydrolase activator NlpD
MPVASKFGELFILHTLESQETKRNLDSLWMNCYFKRFKYNLVAECNPLKEKTKSKKLWFVGIVGGIVFLFFLWLFLTRFEGEPPEIGIELKSPFIGKSHDFSVSIADKKSGLRKVWIAMVKDGKEEVLIDERFPSAGFFSGGEIKNKTLNIAFEPKKYEFSDGSATLRLAVWDYSWRGWWKGNQTYIEKSLTIDTQPPQIEVVSSEHNLNQGGAGLVIYRTSEDCRQTGVQVGDDFFPGYSGYYQDPRIQMAFIGLDYRQGPETPIMIKAVDEAGNDTVAGLRHHIQKKVFKNDRIQISDQFLNWKLPEFENAIPLESSGSLVDKFLKINRDLREADYQKIAQLVETTTNGKLWEGTFLRMPGSANEAGFADHRVYEYNHKIIDRQVHLGLDLASVKHAPVPAANNGIVVFSGLLGIYGRTILVDHGFGLFSMYAHLNRSDVSKGQHVSKGEILGRTGSTGLAGGDHLHFSILVNKTFVNPIEWWDAAWIENNILSKIEAVAAPPAHNQ